MKGDIMKDTEAVLTEMRGEYDEILQNQEDELAELQAKSDELFAKFNVLSSAETHHENRLKERENRLKERANFNLEEQRNAFDRFKERYVEPIKKQFDVVEDKIKCLKVDIEATKIARGFLDLYKGS